MFEKYQNSRDNSKRNLTQNWSDKVNSSTDIFRTLADRKIVCNIDPLILTLKLTSYLMESITAGTADLLFDCLIQAFWCIEITNIRMNMFG